MKFHSHWEGEKEEKEEEGGGGRARRKVVTKERDYSSFAAADTSSDLGEGKRVFDSVRTIARTTLKY
jgi:hypothetical protein